MDMEFLIRKMEKYADEKGIPIMEKDGIRFLTEFIKLNKVKNILEIGSAIGYSAICMANMIFSLLVIRMTDGFHFAQLDGGKVDD